MSFNFKDFFTTLMMTKHGKFSHAIRQNNTKKMIQLLKDEKFDYIDYQFYWDICLEEGKIESVAVLLDYSNLNPAQIDNNAIKKAFKLELFDTVDLLSTSEKVMMNLKKDDINIFNYVQRKILKNKIEIF
jgi:hypothetical protein